MSDAPRNANVAAWLADPMPSGVARSIERLAASDDVQRVAVMPDVHLARDVCIGAVVATSTVIYPAAIGGDIGCGMAAIQFDADAEVLANERAAAQTLSGLYARVPTNKHPSGTMPHRLPDELDSRPLSDSCLDRLKRRDGRVQLGTLGRGNHFVEFQADQQNRLWLMVHSGSRAVGQAITAHHLHHAQTSGSGLAQLDSESDAGRAYLADVEWARSYAAQNRLAMLRAASELLHDLFGICAAESSLMHADHNHVRPETHFGETLLVHRKGAQSAQIDEPGMIPGSMGAASFHVAGRGLPESLCSSSHGAGRALSRTDARKTVSRRQLERQLGSVWFDHRRANALRDEAPVAYKDIHVVMRAQRKLTRIVRELRPVLCYKGV